MSRPADWMLLLPSVMFEWMYGENGLDLGHGFERALDQVFGYTDADSLKHSKNRDLPHRRE